jgi:predicted RNA binding protein YcfA (HicA-like mRNA interferase family)
MLAKMISNCYHANMSKRDKLVKRITAGSEVSFTEAVNLLTDLGYTHRIHGSHHHFKKAGLPIITIVFRDPIHRDAVKDLKKALEIGD